MSENERRDYAKHAQDIADQCKRSNPSPGLTTGMATVLLLALVVRTLVALRDDEKPPKRNARRSGAVSDEQA